MPSPIRGRKRYWLQLQRQAAGMRPALQRKLFAVYDLIQEEMSDAKLASFVARGGITNLVDAVLETRGAKKALSEVAQQVNEMVKAGATRGLLPKSVMLAASDAFGIFNPAIIDAVTGLGTQVVNNVKIGVREALIEATLHGQASGKNPRAIARDIRESVGLTKSQVSAVRNYERMIREGDTAALARKLRDRRFDGTLRRVFAGEEELSEKDIAHIVSRYRERYVNYHAETLARTASLDSLKLGNRLGWEAASEQGIVDRNALVKTWTGVKDEREREEHLEMEGETVGFDEAFSNGEMTPGESTYNCRCVAVYSER